jgi:hypothetical protein
MPSKDRFPVIEHGRKHTKTASIIGRRLLDFGVATLPAARYVFTEAARRQAVQGTDVTHRSLHPLRLPENQEFAPEYLRHMDRDLYFIDHWLKGREVLLDGANIDEGVVTLRNREDLGRAELRIDRINGRNPFTLRQADSKLQLKSASPQQIEEKAAAEIIQGLLLQQTDIDADSLRAVGSVDQLLLMLSAQSPKVSVQRDRTFNTSGAEDFNASTLQIGTEELRTVHRKPLMIDQKVICRGILAYQDHPGIVGTVGLSIATGGEDTIPQAVLQGWIDIPPDQSLTVPERNHILNETIRDYQTADGFFEAFDRQLQAIA